MAKTIIAVFDMSQRSRTPVQWQYDYNTTLKFIGLGDLPDNYEVDLSNSVTGESQTVIGDSNGCVIPPQFFIPGTTIYAWVFIVDHDGGYTRAQVEIPISPRAVRTGDPPTPAQQSALDDAIARLNDAAAEMEENAMTPEEREKLSGIEAGAEVNDIDRIEYWAGANWRPLPIVNKTVQLPIVDIPEQVFYPEFTVEDSGDDLVVTEASHTASQIVSTARLGTYSITAKVALDGTTYYLPMCEASNVVTPWRCAFAGEIRDGAFLRIYDVSLEWRVSIYEGVAYDAYIDAMQGIDEALDEIVSVPDGGTTNQVLAKASDDDGDLKWVNQSGGGGGTSDYTDLSNKPQINGHTLSGNQSASDLGLAPAGAYVKPSGGIPKTDLASGVQTSLGKADSAYQKPSGGIPATDLASGVIPSVPSASSATPQALGTAAAGTSTDYSRADHVHAKPTYSKGDVGLGNVDNVQQYSATNPPPYPVTSVNGQTGAVTISVPSSAADVGAVAVAQGVAHAGEFVVVGSDGNITTVTMSVWQGGNY